MRDALLAALGPETWNGSAAHLGLAYGALCPPAAALHRDAQGLAAREAWLGRVVGLHVPADYRGAAQAWLHGLLACGARVMRGTLTAPLLVGHGNSAPSEVGLSLHHTWGVPMIPGSGVKGLVAHYLAACYGPDPSVADESGQRLRCQPAQFDGRRVVAPPGSLYTRLFGAPDVDGREAQARAGEVMFFDALLAAETTGQVLQRDVLTPHQRRYYESVAPDAWPDEYEAPTPVPFVSVRRGRQFVFAVAARHARVPPALVDLAVRLLRDALEHWGAGGKTARGYGRFKFDDDKTAAAWLRGEREALERARMPRLSPGERWAWLVAHQRERRLLDWVQAVYLKKTRRSVDLVAELQPHDLDPDREDAALRVALDEAGFTAAWRRGRTRDSADVGLGAERLRERAAALASPEDAPPLSSTAAWHAELDAAGDFAALRALAQALQAGATTWPLSGLEALLARLRAETSRRAKPDKRAFVESFARHVATQRAVQRNVGLGEQ